MIDSHAHITSENYDIIDEIVNYLKEKGIVAVLNAADRMETVKEVINLSKKYDNYLLPCVGIHPESVEEIEKLDELEEIIKTNKVYAIGEIGLDYYYTKDNKDKQIELFEKQLDLAEKYKLPIVVHTRDSIQDVYDILKKRNLKGVIHCFNGSYEMAKLFIKLGYKLGIGGVVTFKNSKLYELIEKIDIENILIETDSPYLSPEPFRGKKNDPSNVFYVAKKIAEIKNIDVEKIIEKTKENTIQTFDINMQL